MPLGEVVGGELGRDPAPGEAETGADHRHRRGRAVDRAQQIGQQARDRQDAQHDRDRQFLGGVRVAARGGREPRADHADHDRAHREVLVAPGVLAEHPLRDEHQHEQAGGERGLDDHQRRQQQGEDLQRPAEDRQPRAGEPASAPEQTPDERHAQMLLVGRLPGVERLERDP